MKVTSIRQTLVRDRILGFLAEGRSVTMAELSLKTYGEATRSHIARVRQQVSILRSAGILIDYERSTKSFVLRGDIESLAVL
jgi:hypothetical protein